MATNPKTTYPSLLMIDPTPNKKYIEWAARRINDYARREEDDNYLQRLANAQKDPEAIRKRPQSDPGEVTNRRNEGGRARNRTRYRPIPSPRARSLG